MPGEWQAGHTGHGGKRVQKPNQINATEAEHLRGGGHGAWGIEHGAKRNTADSRQRAANQSLAFGVMRSLRFAVTGLGA
jgi:hypothetical protein